MDVSGTTVLLKDCYFYLLYKRKGDEQTQIPILLDKTYDSATDTISASFEPTSYFTEKNGGLDIQVFACSTEQDFISEDVDIEDVALWTSFNAQISIAKSQLKDSQTIVAEDMFTKGIAEMSAYLDSAESEADDAEEYASDAEEFAKGTRSDGLTVPHASTGAHDNAKDYKDLAKDWASKIGGAVESGEYSAKYYAVVSDTRSQEAEAYALGTKGGTPVPSFADKNAKDWATKTGTTVDGTNYSSKQYALNAKASADIVAEHATAIDSIYADLTNIDAVATDIQDEDSIINTVAENIQDVNVVAESITDVNIVAGKTTQITTVAGIASDVITVAGIDSDVTAVAGIASDVSAVEDIKTDVSAVAAIDTDVSAVSAIKDDVSAVATIDDDVTTVATDIADVSAVASDITKVTAVADDLTNIDAVADDLTNIDNAEANALKAEGWANGTQNGTPVSSDSPYYENNAKYWADAVPDLKSAIDNNSQRIENLEVAVSGSLVQTNVLTDPPSMANVRTITNANDILPWAILKRVGARAVAWNQLCNYYTTITGFNVTVNNGLIRLEKVNNALPSGSTVPICPQVEYASGHRLYVDIKVISKPSTIGVYLNYTDPWTSRDVSEGGVVEYLTANAGCKVRIILYGSMAIGDVVEIKAWFSDMNIMNESSLAADQFRAKYPASYYPYNTGSIIPLNPSAFKVVGKNKWDEEMESGYWRVSDGVAIPDANKLRCKNPIAISPSTAYYLKFPTGANIDFNYTFFDIEGNYISGGWTTSNTSVPTPPNAYYMKFYMGNGYGTTYNNNIMICLNSVTDKTYKEYKETTIDTSQISDGHYVNDSVYDYVENVMENGVTKGKKHKGTGEVSNISLFSHQGNNLSSGGLYYADYNSSLIKTYGSAICNLLPFKATGAWESTTPCLQVGNGRLRIYTTASTQSALLSLYSDIHIYYGLKEEIVTDVEPIRNFPVEDGTTITAVTPQTDLVNAVDVPSTIAYMTKIAS